MYFSRVSGQKWKFWRQALFGTLMVSFVLPRFLHYNFGENFVRQAVASVQLQSCPTLCNPMDCNMPGFPLHHSLPELSQTHVHWVGDAIQPSHPLLFPSLPALSLSQHQSLFQWVRPSHQVAKVLEFQLQHQSFQWTFRVDFLQDWLVISLLS